MNTEAKNPNEDRDTNIKNDDVMQDTIIGNIENIEAGILFGWAAYEDSANPISLIAKINGKQIGIGIADQFREDLRIHGIHDGFHSFKIPLDPTWCNTPGLVEICLYEENKDTKILIPKFEYTIELSPYKIKDEKLEDSRLSFFLETSKVNIDAEIQISQDNEILLKRIVNESSKKAQLSVQLPKKYHDGVERTYNIYTAGYPQLLGSIITAIQPKPLKIQQPSTQNTSMHNGVIGNIESIEAGFLKGWIAYTSTSEPISLQIEIDGRIVGYGVADKYRPDLKSHDIHNGSHGFEIELDPSWCNIAGKKEIHVQDSTSGQEFKLNKFFYEVLAREFNLHITSIIHGNINCSVQSNQSLKGIQIDLYHEDNLISELKIEENNTTSHLSLPIPIKFHNGEEHLFKIGIKGFPQIYASAVGSLPPINTPWKYLKESYLQGNILRISPAASHCYESLKHQTKLISQNKSPFTLESLLLIHNIVLEGYEDRTSFPAFSLPKYKKPRVSIIVPAYNKFELTYHCIASIALAYNTTSYEVILADDCSSDETQTAEEIIGNLVVSKNPENLKFLLSCNRAAKLAQGEFIITLNNDTEVTSFWLDELIRHFDRDPSVGMTGSKLLNTDGSLQEAGGIVWEDGQPWNVGRDFNPWSPEFNYCREVDYLTGAAMCIRTAIWQEIGGFSEEYVPCYYEDTDIAFKVREAGFKTLYVPHSQVIHFEGKSHGTDVTKGLKRYQVINEKTFRKKWYSAYRHNGQASIQNMMLHKDRNVNKRVLVIDYATPTPNKDAGSYAAIQEIKLIQSLGFKVTFVPENMAHMGIYTTELQRMGVEVLYSPFYVSVNDVLSKRLAEMDTVYITRYDVAEKYIPVIRQKSKAKIIFNNADLHFLRELRAAIKNQHDPEQIQQALSTRDKELRVCREADAVLCYNSTEHAIITSHTLEADKLHITPWVLNYKPKGPEFAKRKGIAFLGGYNHKPNVEAVEYLVSEIMPELLRQRPDIKLHVYGSSMPKHFKDYESANISMPGFAEELDQVYHNHRVFVAPLLSGAGIKGKVLEALAYGTPAILSDIAAEGIGLSDGVSTLIANSKEQWVSAIIALYDNQSLWEKISDNERVIAEQNFSFSQGKERFRRIFESLGIYSVQ